MNNKYIYKVRFVNLRCDPFWENLPKRADIFSDLL